MKPAWNQSPETLEQFLYASDHYIFAEQTNGSNLRDDQTIVLTLQLMRDIARRILALESVVDDVR